MNRLFRLDSPIMQTLNRVADLIILNILWLLCCIPIVTIGSSATALYRCTLDMVLKVEQTSILRRFFSAFRANLKVATIVWLILLIPTLLVAMNLWLLISGTLQASIGMILVCLIPLVILLAIAPYSFAYVAMFEDKPLVSIKNAALLSLANLPRTIVVIIMNCIPFALPALSLELFLRTSIIWPLIGVSIIYLLTSKMIIKVFIPFLPKEDKPASLFTD